MQHFGKWGNLYVESLRENAPEAYRQLEASGELATFAQDAQRRAERQHDDLMAQLQKKHPPPKGYVATVQHLTSLKAMADELVAADVIVPPPPENEPAESSEPTSS